jgi:hypothetical protein
MELFITISVRTSDPAKWYRIWRQYQNIQLRSIGSIDGCSGLESNLRFRCYRVASKYVVTTDCHLYRDNHAEYFIYTCTYIQYIIQLPRPQNEVNPCCCESCLFHVARDIMDRISVRLCHVVMRGVNFLCHCGICGTCRACRRQLLFEYLSAVA